MKILISLLILLYSNSAIAYMIDYKAKEMNKTVDLSMAFEKAALATGIDVKLLRAVCFVESSHNPNVVVLMDHNAPSYGICQLQMRTAKEMGFKGSSKDLMYAPLNIYFAAKYLARWLTKTQGHKAKAVISYNRGHLTKLTFGTYAAKVFLAMNEGR